MREAEGRKETGRQGKISGSGGGVGVGGGREWGPETDENEGKERKK